jgi:predicted enzyme related to lactoylglutathione lyase
MAIRGIHGLLYSSDAAATRAFFRDACKFPTSDIGEGWLIFDFPEGDLGIHPLDHGGTAGDHDVSFYCDDIEGTVKDLKSRGVTFTGDVQDHGYGLVTHFVAPGGITIQLYEPRYTKPAKPRASASRPSKKRKPKAKAKPARKPAKKKRRK